MEEFVDGNVIAPLAIEGGVLYIEGVDLSSLAKKNLSETTEDEEVAGVIPDLNQVTTMLSHFSERVLESLKNARPGKVTVEFGCDLAVETGGGLTLLIGKGSIKSNLKITLEWEASKS